ncbi:tRNA (adenosine(37)-N6)-dimethylallyltransferase MiaA [Candidatus Peregrinibacteria bacterium CG10_big_fil_rev_8_21_14_0_10_55_24]|nr:MAG: tRNA (adenosine(37)-N6)-dimethylallyltransferase MiaA [Candidatus Peregrinibacteria bacterium CG10_big_fil_rev_8_21_14_0_10_55_24]
MSGFLRYHAQVSALHASLPWLVDLDAHLQSAKRPLIVVLGPTASGKTACSIALAHWISEHCKRRSEVVNADSRQLYRHLTIGTAKIRGEEMQGIPHHLLDVLDPREESTAGWYQTQASQVIGEIEGRGAVPMLVGGSMLYVSAVTDGLTMAPSPDRELRERLMEEYDRDHGESLYERLHAFDPDSAKRIHRRNKPRLVRAVEICELTRQSKSKTVPRGELGAKSDPRFDLVILGMEWPRRELMERITQRTERMFADGWMEEVRRLLAQGYTPQDPGMKSHGYREIMRALLSGNLDEAVLMEEIAQKSRKYAKRQLTWWRRDRRIRWITPDSL